MCAKTWDSLATQLNKALPFPLFPVSPPEPLGFPRKQLDTRFAVLLMRSSYDAVDALDFIPKQQFEAKFWKLRQSELEGYNYLYSPIKMRAGDLSDPLYFDFISFSQYATISREMGQPQRVFEEYYEICPPGAGDDDPCESGQKVVTRPPQYADDSQLPAYFFQKTGDLIYDGLLNGFRGEDFGGPPPAPAGASIQQLAAGVQQLLSIMKPPTVSNSRPSLACRASNSNGSAGLQHSRKDHDVIGLSNLCVDIVIPVQQLPPADPEARQGLLQQLTAEPPDEQHWELGGNCNFMIAAARMGMRVGSIGHVGDDTYGRYMDRVLQEERIEAITRIMPATLSGTDLDRTLLCFVLVDPDGKHAFCSRYDFGPWPLLGGVSNLPPSVTQVLQSTAAVFTNGFVFDELPLELVKQAIRTASDAGAAVLFDPGPRAFTMKSGSRRAALDTLISLSDVVLMTEEEAVEVTGLLDPQAAAEAVLARPGCKTEWCVVKLGGEGALLVTKSPQLEVYRAGAFKVDVKDTLCSA
ncbi:hypothetical protein OEZ85_008410 [Tetradesmus obliquus]|uniref:Carbohydrate kinase PfkB domain-containing protein n=1 Tax=Tetradesmus obliquus TaxID=3088 RepID=A0ABY8TIR1_TETOB|nr:hypothetical protein OEZ85_008410 [Tetradesmus obliquus]